MDIANYLYSLIEELKIERLKKRNGKQIAILDYIDSLKENPILLRETLLNYTRVLGATNQQTLSKKMTEVKKNDSFFENVFIDEAATSSPLDLFIPMSVAKGRIILVGDHKQLPNIVNENIVKKIEKDSISGEDGVSYLASQIKTTMFERLIETAHKLEEKDGIRRVITLNTQFRMHPKLGDIVSRNFYMDEGGLKSVKPESDFAHNYKGLNNKYLYWIDVPYNEAYKEKYRVNNSRRNKDEAEKIAQHIKEALNSDTYNNETIGVITFYREQVHEIKEALRVKGIFDDNYNLTAYYSGLDLLVGTVDAFQGKEFDVVYLSIVYTYDEKDSSRETYSRLKLFTLLNVAVSRQKKLLICVGDMKIFKTERAKNYVPCMYEISKICEGGGLHE